MLAQATVGGLGAVGHGLATVTDDGTVLDTWYPATEVGVVPGSARTVALTPEQAGLALGAAFAACLRPDPRRAVAVIAVRTSIEDLAQPPRDAHDVYLRLHLLMHGDNRDGSSAAIWMRCAGVGRRAGVARL